MGFYKNPSNRSRFVSCVGIDGQTDMKKQRNSRFSQLSERT